MRDLYRSYMREFGFSLLMGGLFIVATVVGLYVFTQPKPLQVADNSVSISAPVSDDTPGPLLNDSGMAKREVSRTSPLADRNR